MAEIKTNFIVIDDSELDCFIAEKMIRHTGKCGTVISFNTAAEALEYVKNREVDDDEDCRTVLILDVLMPLMSGFAFVEEFEKLPHSIQDRYFIVALTSSMNRNDMDKIKSYRSVRLLLDKPITSEAISAFIAADKL
ncbi:response regulator [Pedobacter sp. SYSU D00535]|uniref:response regulator n=1 Tax=Pedobacter sp. SYSU D00535 TaxID=2810308 RepID=UPI001A96712A|nr:response regulator [Pedobacter sp. SYSU D00535]